MEVIRLSGFGWRPYDPRVFETRVFDSAESFVKQFRDGLYNLLRRDDLTASQVVLVANNAIATGDLALFGQAMANIFRTAASASEEDRQILTYLASVDDPMAVMLRRVTDSGLVFVYNQLRQYRPRRAASEAPTTLWRQFDQTKFNFNKVPTEMFASVGCQSGRVHLFYNKFPYDAYHVLLVPVPDNNYPQFLNVGNVALWEELFAMISAVLPDSVMGYNSLGAYASINQLHFHLIYGSKKLVIPGRRDGVFGQTVNGRGASWPLIDPIQAANQPFNLVQDSDGLTVIPQHGQRAVGPTWSTGFAWFELAGGFIFIDLESFETLEDAAIWSAYQDLIIQAA